MQTIWLARHANRQDFADSSWVETADRPHDPGLSPDGVDQARQLGRQVATLGVDRILASPFLRTVETAHHVGATTDDPVYLEPGLGEWLNPDWFEAPPEILSVHTLQDQFERVDLSHDPCLNPTYPETKTEALQRLGETAQCLVERYEEETLLLVGHGITVLGVLHGLVGPDVPDPGCPLASLTEVVHRDGSWHVNCRNETGHLDEGPEAGERLI